MHSPVRPLGYYLRMMLVAYAVWAALFIGIGILTADLPGYDLRIGLDHAIPLWEWTVWIYSFCYIIPVFAVLAVQDGHRLNRLLVAVFVSTLSAAVVYAAVPVIYPYPEIADTVSGRFLAWQVALDFEPGGNKLPSLHVANAFLVWLAVRSRGRAWSWALLAAAVIISASTLTTKRHLVGDVVLGTAWAFWAWWASGILHRRWFDRGVPGRESLLKRVGMLRS
ncbi:MAG: phosphatase PAP2 family protein [Rhodothermales bacterium]|nr:phosphatase PAP2 family protein [Rhodothermales bacterium]MBO6780043.1 phosphatase PAP2 family protein [Rhodothermales bacterium]